MKKKLLFFFFLCCSTISYGQFACPKLTSPIDGETDVPVDATLMWNTVDGVPSYLISLGTTPGGTDILENQGSDTPSFTPPFGLPENTNIYITITLFFFDSDNIACTSEMFRTEDVIEPPDCTSLVSPADGTQNVNVHTPISWSYAPKSTGYFLTLGTSPGASDILENEEIIGENTYQPPNGLPFETEIYVQIIPFNENGLAPLTCMTYSFTTEDMVERPLCTSLIAPIDGAINVPLTPLIEWTPVQGAIGYRVSLGNTPNQNDILDNAIFTKNSTFVIDFLPSQTYFITIIPYNRAGEAIGCGQSSFTTIFDCSPITDPTTGTTISFKPELNFPDEVAVCLNENETLISSNTNADGYRWFKLNDDGSETLLSETNVVLLSEVGRYRIEVYNILTQDGASIECSNSKKFVAVTSEVATITTLVSADQGGTFQISVIAEGIGDYEYALDNAGGPYQEAPVFNSVSEGSHIVYVRDRNGCGIIEKITNEGLTGKSFPKFFTPNGDGINDFWQLISPEDGTPVEVRRIDIFNQYGVFLLQVDPTSRGWDGNFNGKPLPSSDYWFKAITPKNKKVQGHFTLKR